MEFINDGIKVSEFVYDFAVDGGAVGAKELTAKANKDVLPQGAVVLDVVYNVITAFTSGGSATVALGNATTAGAFKAATAFNDATFAASTPAVVAAAAPYLVNTAAKAKVVMTVAVAALTAGKLVAQVRYLLPKTQA